MKMPESIFPLLLLMCHYWDHTSMGGALAGAQGGSMQTNRNSFIETLTHETNPSRQLNAAESLAPYVQEPSVKGAFIGALDTVVNDAVRLVIVRALGQSFPADGLVQEKLAKVLVTERNASVRVAIANTLGKQLDNPRVLAAWIHAVKNDGNDAVRLKVSHDLSSKMDVPQVYDQMLRVGLNDRCDLVRETALDALETKIRERAELREVFINLLDRPNLISQYHGVKGLMVLNDPSDKAGLVEKAKHIIDEAKRSPMSMLLAGKTLDLLRRLDPQAAQTIRLN